MSTLRGASRRMDTPVAGHDILPTLVELAGGDPQDLACAIDRCSVVPMMSGDEQPDRIVMGEYCAEGSVAPMLMIRQGKYKYVYCEADPTQLYGLDADPQELQNLAADADYASVLTELETVSDERWDLPRFKAEVMQSQACRWLVGEANRQGRFTPWDYQPQLDARERWMRNHMDLNVVDSNNRYPK